jgi:hypothetical protein
MAKSWLEPALPGRTEDTISALPTRRSVLLSPLALVASSVAGGCGGDEAEPSPGFADTQSAEPGTTTDRSRALAAAAAPSAQRKYRFEQPLLFQGTLGPLPSVLPGGTSYVDGLKYGPTRTYIDSQAGWAWRNLGGDWIDAAGVSQGPKPWASWTQTARMVTGQVATVTMDISAIARRGGWMAMLLRCLRAQRKIRSVGAERPTVTYHYQDGTTETQVATVMAYVGSTGELPSLLLDPMPAPLFIEFRRPTKPVRAATMALVMTDGQWSSYGGPAELQLMVLTPPVNTDPVTTGSAQRHVLDDALHAEPGVIHVHRYLANTRFEDFVHTTNVNTDNEANFDPHAIDPAKPQDLSKLPHVAYGKWVGVTQGWLLMKPGDADFVPLHPALGAMRIKMNKAQIKGADGLVRPIQNGDVVGYGGSLSGHAFLYLPADRIYRQRRLFVRHYMRLTYPGGKPRPSDRKQVYSDRVGGQIKWSDLGGKFGLTPGGHHNSYGGYSGSAGGGRGTQFRSGWLECSEGVDGPGENGWYASWHLYDYNWLAVPGHKYVASAKRDYCWGQRGGLGGVLYAGHWYCIELECLLNSVDQPAVLADGTPHVVDGVRQFWTPDGELRVWIDGRLAFERTGMAFRSLPVVDAPYRYGYSRPVAPLGHVYAGMNVFHGGVTQDCVDRHLDITGVVVSESRIGPMRLA